jgi:hypothetical protein
MSVSVERVFEGTVKSLLEVLADYASILLVNKHYICALLEGADNRMT